MFKLLSVIMALTIVLTGCTGKQGEQGERGEQGPQGVAGKDGQTPTITINEEGYWVINGEVTEYKAVASDGKNGVNGKDGQTPVITVNKDGYWVINGVVTEYKAVASDGTNGTDGKDGETPTITINKDGYWVINGEVTNVKATGNDGKPGADGKDGKDGETPTIEINEEGYWVINGVVTEYKAVVDNSSNTIAMEGDGQTFHRFAPTALSFRSTAPLSEFQEVKVNGETVDPSNYTLTEGSTIVTFNIDYLQSLGATKHQVTVVSDSVSANANFEVIEPELNEHGFYYNQPYVGDVGGASMAFLFGENGTVSLVSLETAEIMELTYSVANNIFTITYNGIELTGTVSETEVYINEFDTILELGDMSFVVCGDYIYVYEEELGGYTVGPLDKTKSEYDAIKTGIYGLPTVKLAYRMFKDNTKLIVAPRIPDSVTIIDDKAFSGCSNLTSITIPNSVTSIGEYAFSETGLTSVVIPDSVTSIAGYAFMDCSELTSVTLGKGVTSISVSTFYGTSLTSIVIDENNRVYDSRNNSNAIIETASNTLIAGCKNTTIPDSVTSIAGYAFMNRSELTSVVIPSSVTSIGRNAFYSCTGLSTINYMGTVAEWNAISKGDNWDWGTPLNKVINYNYTG